MKKFKPSSYYEAKIQIRPKDEELINFVYDKIKINKIIISDVLELKEGIDVYIDSAEFSIKLGKLFRNKYNIKPKVTRSLVGENKQLGKQIHKLTVLLKIN